METTAIPMTQAHLFETLVVAIVFAGLLGGLVNFYLSHRSDPEDNNLWKSITMGVVAAFLVPLFLTTISSKLVEAIRTEPNDQSKNILVFFGFCLVAAISSKAFIQSISKRVLDEAREAKKTAQAASKKASEIQSAVEPIIQKETEREPEATETGVVATLPKLNNQEWNVLEHLARGEKLLRTRTSLGRETGMSHAEVSKIMDTLREKNLVASKEMQKENGAKMRRWYITSTGRDIVEAHLASKAAAGHE
jgi:DNA-binding MarR family transcriptional regulator